MYGNSAVWRLFKMARQIRLIYWCNDCKKYFKAKGLNTMHLRCSHCNSADYRITTAIEDMQIRRKIIKL